ncbi:MAG: hypothetical protein ABSA11_14640 [Candidatus Bathyarchaeia archaeon]|jgi:hypothetical protein
MNLRNPTLIITVGGLLLLVILGYGYGAVSSNIVQGLAKQYDLVIDAHVNVPPATASAVGTGYNSTLWTANILSADFGSVAANQTSTIIPITITNIGLPDDTRLHVRTDLSTPGVHLYIAETNALFPSSKVDLSRSDLTKGITYQIPVAKGSTKIPAFGVRIDPGTPAQDISFHIIVSYSYCND